MNIFVLDLVLIYSTVFTKSVFGTVRRQLHDGILYEDYASDSYSVVYSITNGQGWDDLDTLAKDNFLTGKAMFCSVGPGTWLLYPDTSFGSTSRQTLKLLYGEMCAPVENVNSIQPLGSLNLNPLIISSALGFSEKFFASVATTVRNESQATGVKSAIFLGDGKWTINAAEGKKICVSTIGTDGDVCLLDNIETAFGVADVTIDLGCEEEAENDTYGLQSCYAPGFIEIAFEVDFSKDGMEKICNGDYDSSDRSKEKFLNVMNIWEYRMKGPDPRATPPFGMTEVKLNLLTPIISIVEATCENLDAEYLDVLQEIFISIHLKEGLIWNDPITPFPGNGSVQDMMLDMWAEAASFIDSCMNEAKQPSVVFNTGCNSFKGSVIDKPDYLQTLEDFLHQESYDFVIEQFYLIFSYTSTYCYNQIGTMDNTWGELPMLLKQEYLYPLRKQWRNPGNWVNYYPLMFNGFDMEMERQSLMNCLQAIILETPFYDPLARPPEFYKGGNSTVAEMIGKPGGDKKSEGDARRKRQWRNEDDESFEGNDIAEKNIPKPSPVTTTTARSKRISSKKPNVVNIQSKLIPSVPTTVKSTTQSTTPFTSTIKVTTPKPISTSSSLPPPSLSTTEIPEIPEEETKRPSSKRRVKGRSGRKRGRRNKKHSKLLRRNKAESLKMDAKE